MRRERIEPSFSSGPRESAMISTTWSESRLRDRGAAHRIPCGAAWGEVETWPRFYD
jgi:hypothetical protein